MSSSAKYGFLTMEKKDNRKFNSVGSSRIRARWVCKYWDKAEEFHIGKKYDAIVFQKVFWERMLAAFEGIKILDICDPVWLQARSEVVRTLDMVDGVVTSTQPLAGYLNRITPKEMPIICIPDRVDLAEHKPIKGEHVGRGESVVWFGFSHNQHYLIKTFDFLIKNNLKLTVVSNQPMVVPRTFEKLRVENVKYSYESIYQELIKHDFALLPQPDDLKGRYKSNNKDLTCWAIGLPVAKVPEDLARFSDPNERNKEARKRRKEVEERWDVRQSVAEWKELLNEIRSGNKRG